LEQSAGDGLNDILLRGLGDKNAFEKLESMDMLLAGTTTTKPRQKMKTRLMFCVTGNQFV
jgi:hypothetical protein